MEDPADGPSFRWRLLLQTSQEVPARETGDNNPLGSPRTSRAEDAPGEYRGVRFGRKWGGRWVCRCERSAARFRGQMNGVRCLGSTLL